MARRSKTRCLKIVDQAARRADQHVDAVLEHVDAASRSRRRRTPGLEREAGVLAEDLRVVVDLHGQLARRRDDEARGAFRRASAGASLRSRRVHRDQECRRLAGAGLGLARDVETGERAWQRLGLDPGAALEAGVGDAAGERLRQVQVGEGNIAEVSV